MNQDFALLLNRAHHLIDRIDRLLPSPLTPPQDWAASAAWRYQRDSRGAGALTPVRHIDSICQDDLLEIDAQKQKLFANTQQFLAGQPANNVLLSGARGTGKSSLIRACLKHFAADGLRLIEVDKDSLIDLPDIAAVANDPRWFFIVYCDDLSFDEGEHGYKALKSILDGSLTSATANLLVYATSNRRHLLPEYASENLQQQVQGDELHPGEVIEEKMSLSERFGLWISFYPFSQEEYLAIAGQWLRTLGCPPERIGEARQEALVWALQRGSRSGRVACQFARDYAGRHRLTQAPEPAIARSPLQAQQQPGGKP